MSNPKFVLDFGLLTGVINLNTKSGVCLR